MLLKDLRGTHSFFLKNPIADALYRKVISILFQVEPINDNQLTVSWFHDGRPLANGHRFRTTHDFGYVSLDILYAFPEDAGMWTCVAKNQLGQAETAASFVVQPRSTIISDTQHPQSWQMIQEMEAPRQRSLPPADAAAEPPKFTEPLESLERIEGQSAHFETRVTPINDPQLKVCCFDESLIGHVAKPKFE